MLFRSATPAIVASTTMASSSSHRTQNPCVDVGAKWNATHRDSLIPNLNCNLPVPILEPSKLATNDLEPAMQVRKWKLKDHRETITHQPKDESVTMHAAANDVRPESSSPSPLPTSNSWTNFLSRARSTPAPLFPATYFGMSSLRQRKRTRPQCKVWTRNPS